MKNNLKKGNFFQENELIQKNSHKKKKKKLRKFPVCNFLQKNNFLKIFSKNEIFNKI